MSTAEEISNSTPQSEQNGSPVTEEKKQHKPVFGVDFGNSKCVVAIGDNNFSLPHIVHNNLANDQTPNLIGFKGKLRHIGEEALNLFVSTPQTTITNIRRLIGCEPAKFLNEQKRIAYKVKSETGSPTVEVLYRNESVEFTSEQLAAMVLTKLAEYAVKDSIAHSESESDMPKFVISVPGSYTENQRNSVLNAAKIAQMNVIGLINDLTAASLCYGYLRNPTEDAKKVVLLIEFGHSYFSAQVVSFTQNRLDVLSSIYDDEIGAQSFDFVLFDHCAEDFKKKTGLDIHSNGKAINRVLRAAEKCKQILSTIPETDITVESLMNDKDLHLKMSRNTMEELSKSVLEKIGENIKKVIENANVPIDSVEVIGGGIRIPSVQAKIKSVISDKELGFSLDSAHCVAMGAALLAKSLSPEFEFQYTVNDPSNSFAPKATIAEEQLEKAMKVNRELVENDKLINLIHTKRNELEAYIYAKRNQLNDPSRASLITNEEKETIQKLLNEAEEYLFDITDDTELNEIVEKTETLQKSVNEACPKLHQQLEQEEEQRKKEAAEAAEFSKNYKPDRKDREEPRTKGEKMDAAKKKKHQGNVCFKDGDFENAVVRYNQALSYFDSIWDLSADQKKEVDEIKLSCHLNNAAAYLKLKNYEKARNSGTEALKIDENNSKALYRRGQANYYLRYFAESKNDFSAALKVEPNNADIKKFLKNASDQLAAQVEKEKTMYKKMFG